MPKCNRFYSQTAQIQIPILPLIGYVTLGKLSNGPLCLSFPIWKTEIKIQSTSLDKMIEQTKPLK